MDDENKKPMAGGPHAYDPSAGRTPDEVTARTGEGHEMRDVRSRPPIVFMISVLVALGLINLVIGGFGLLLRWQNRAAVRAPSPLQSRQAGFPEPRLQSDPKADMDRMTAEQRSLMNQYGWVDRAGGVVRIPVDRAMDLIVQRGFAPRRHDIPTTAAAAAVTTATLKGGPTP